MIVSRTLASGTLGVVLLLCGCTAQAEPAVTTTTTATVTATPSVTAPVVSDEWPKTANDLQQGSLHRDLELDGENFTITVDYWVEFDIATWTTSAPKKVNYSIHLEPVEGKKTPTVLVGGLTANASLLSLTPELNGLVQSVQTDSPSGIPGYNLNDGYPYEGNRPISGISPSLITAWAQVAGNSPLTEGALQTAGVYGTQLTFDLSLLIKSTGETNWHKRFVSDVLTVPVSPVEPTAETTSAATSDSGSESPAASGETVPPTT